MRRLLSERLLVGVQERGVRSRAVGPVGIIRQLDRDTQVASASASIIDFDQRPAGPRRPNVDQRAISGSVRTGGDRLGALQEDLDRHTACRYPAMRLVDVKPIAIAD